MVKNQTLAKPFLHVHADFELWKGPSTARTQANAILQSRAGRLQDTSHLPSMNFSKNASGRWDVPSNSSVVVRLGLPMLQQRNRTTHLGKRLADFPHKFELVRGH